MSPNEMKALQALASAYSGYEEFCYLSFRGIATRSGLDLKLVRRTVRSLARKGFAQYGRGLWNDDGEMAGSGYCCTKAGYAADANFSSARLHLSSDFGEDVRASEQPAQGSQVRRDRHSGNPLKQVGM